jgi:hypothetical protein
MGINYTSKSLLLPGEGDSGALSDVTNLIFCIMALNLCNPQASAVLPLSTA